jgi:hypothetical protein
VIRLAEERGIGISDSVVIGDVHQNVTNIKQHIDSGISCPKCHARNVRMFDCLTLNCAEVFCEICHPLCRLYKQGASRFDSGKGTGPFCNECMSAKEKAIMEAAAAETKAHEHEKQQDFIHCQKSVRMDILEKNNKQIKKNKQIVLFVIALFGFFLIWVFLQYTI